MRIARVATLDELDAERERWERLERVDPHAGIFMSWRWFRSYVPVARHRVVVLALRDAGTTIAYLPLARGGSILDRELLLGGNPTADRAGMLVAPGDEERAIAAFADAIVAEPWDGFTAGDVDDPRIERLVRRIAERGMRLERIAEHPARACDLPDAWETYLTQRITKKTRLNLRRVERRLAEAVPALRISEPAAGNVDAHVDAMIALHHARRGGNLRNARRRYGGLFRNAFDAGILRMFVSWDGARPIAGATAFVDARGATFSLYMLGFDEAYGRYAPGRVIVGHALRTAIAEGYRRFDFLRGDEPYKARFAAELYYNKEFRLIRPGLRAAAIEYLRPKALALKLAAASLVYGPGRTA